MSQHLICNFLPPKIVIYTKRRAVNDPGSKSGPLAISGSVDGLEVICVRQNSFHILPQVFQASSKGNIESKKKIRPARMMECL